MEPTSNEKQASQEQFCTSLGNSTEIESDEILLSDVPEREKMSRNNLDLGWKSNLRHKLCGSSHGKGLIFLFVGLDHELSYLSYYA